MSDVPHYLLRRMYPRDKCLQIVKYKNEDFIQLLFINVIAPIAIPAPPYDLGNLKLPDDIGKILHIYINGINVPLTPKFLMDDVVFWFAGKEHTWKSVMEESSAANAVLAVGGKVATLIRKKSFPKEVQDTLLDRTETELKVEVSLENPKIFSVIAVLHITGDFDPSKL